MDIKKDGLLESIYVMYNKRKKMFSSHAEIKIDGYTIKIEIQYYDTIDEAVTDLKERIITAINKFYKKENELDNK